LVIFEIGVLALWLFEKKRVSIDNFHRKRLFFCCFRDFSGYFRDFSGHLRKICQFSNSERLFSTQRQKRSKSQIWPKSQKWLDVQKLPFSWNFFRSWNSILKFFCVSFPKQTFEPNMGCSSENMFQKIFILRTLI